MALLIENNGREIKNTNYWNSPHAKRGFLFLTWNAGAARLLVPGSARGILAEMRGAREVIVSRGPWIEQGRREALEMLWEDGSDAPFCLHLVAEQTDRLIPESDQGGGFIVSAWTRDGKRGEWPGKYRVVPEIPWLQPWEGH